MTATLHGDGMPAVIPPAVAGGTKDAKLAVPARFTYAVLLTRGCDIDHGKIRQLGLVRPLADVTGVEDQAAVIEGRCSSLFYLPKGAISITEELPEGFVDFRYVVTIHEDLLSRLRLNRCLALTPDGLMDLYFGWLRHTLGPQVARTTPCPTCGSAVEVFQLVDEMMRPPDDY
ncbi:MAG: hypothetical protein HY905_19525 [Deltaproteobacteria bacterium]|nr:hypothetical protein [Deltaproteobacteria bacterium]